MDTSATASFGLAPMVSFRRRVFRLTLIYHSDLLEAHLGAIMLLWGAWIATPWLDTFENPAYAAMKQVCPEWSWGLSMVALGFIQQAGTLYEHRAIRRIACFTAAMQWLFMGIEVMRVSPPAPGCAILPFLALSNALCYVRLTKHWRSVLAGI